MTKTRLATLVFSILLLTVCVQCASNPAGDEPVAKDAASERTAEETSTGNAENRGASTTERATNPLEVTLNGCTEEWVSLDDIRNRLGKLKPYALTCDLCALSSRERKVLALLCKASCCMDKAFSFQVYEWNYCLEALLNRTVMPGVELYETYFKAMFGPWDRLDEDRPFLVQEKKPAGANFYPKSMTREEFKTHITNHPEDREAFESLFTMIRRENDTLRAVPYSLFFKDQILPTVSFLKEAAEITEEPTLRHYLYSRAAGLLSNDYFESDMAWMDLDGPLEVVIGPYEVYEDKLFGYKAAFQSQVCIVDREESGKLATIESYLDKLEDNLPIPDEHKNFNRGEQSPIKVVNQFFAGGDSKAGILTAAFNLPNDERVREAKGSKKVMLKNVMKAKFETCSVPIAEEVLCDRDLARVSFDAFFNLFLMHEISHSLGPGKIVKDGRETTVNLELRDRYSQIEEAVADSLALYNIRFLVDEGVLPADLKATLYSTYLADLFRGLRFGVSDAHGGAMAMQLGYLLEKKAIGVDEKGLFFIDDGAIAPAVKGLARDLLMFEALGDYEGAGAFIEKYTKIGPECAACLKRLDAIPIDIRPLYPQAEAMLEKEAEPIR